MTLPRWLPLAAIGALLALLAFGVRRDGFARDELRRLTVEADSLRREDAARRVALAQSERTAAAAVARADSVARRAVVVLVRTETVSDDSRAVLADSTATLGRVRAQLVVQVASTDSLAVAFRTYLAADTVRHAATDALTRGLRAAVALGDRRLVVEADRYRALAATMPTRWGRLRRSARDAAIGAAVLAVAQTALRR